jgi:hypothetical protein
MTIHDLRVKILREGELMIDSFPLKPGGSEMDLEIKYKNVGLGMYACKLKQSTSKIASSVYLTIFQNHLYFSQQDPKDPQFYVNKYKYALRHLEVQMDSRDSKSMNIIVKDKAGYIDLSLLFEDSNKAGLIKRILEENRKSARNMEYKLLDSFFDELINKWKY